MFIQGRNQEEEVGKNIIIKKKSGNEVKQSSFALGCFEESFRFIEIQNIKLFVHLFLMVCVFCVCVFVCCDLLFSLYKNWIHKNIRMLNGIFPFSVMFFIKRKLLHASFDLNSVQFNFSYVLFEVDSWETLIHSLSSSWRDSFHPRQQLRLIFSLNKLVIILKNSHELTLKNASPWDTFCCLIIKRISWIFYVYWFWYFIKTKFINHRLFKVPSMFYTYAFYVFLCVSFKVFLQTNQIIDGRI